MSSYSLTLYIFCEKGMFISCSQSCITFLEYEVGVTMTCTLWQEALSKTPTEYGGKFGISSS